MIPYHKRFTYQVIWSVIKIGSPYFFAQPSQTHALRKRSGFIFPNTDHVTWCGSPNYAMSHDIGIYDKSMVDYMSYLMAFDG